MIIVVNRRCDVSNAIFQWIKNWRGSKTAPVTIYAKKQLCFTIIVINIVFIDIICEKYGSKSYHLQSLQKYHNQK